MLNKSELEDFWKKLAEADRRILMLDYDGTLAPFRVERDKAVPYPGVADILNRIAESDSCRMVIVSGRNSCELPPLLGLKTACEIWGSHGFERMFPDGRIENAPLDGQAENVLTKAREAAVKLGFENLIEEKPGCLALHWRGQPENRINEIRTKTEIIWGSFADGKTVGLHSFDGGLELRASGRDKGDAVRAVLSEEKEIFVAAYLGDDTTDEDAFVEINGKGLSVLVREELHESEAQMWLRPPDELLDFLRRWHDTCTGSRRSA
ncbi:MAG: trehalose-phosphatase [Planctomycetota bacterium]|jgi:trehalose-phosphatase